MSVKSVCWGVVALLVIGSLASAGPVTISQSKSFRSAEVDWEYFGNDEVLELTIRNLTKDAEDVSWAVTGFSFALSDGFSLHSLDEVVGDLIVVTAPDGEVSPTTGNPTNWGIGHHSDYAALSSDIENVIHFTGTAKSDRAKHAILGEATTSGGSESKGCLV